MPIPANRRLPYALHAERDRYESEREDRERDGKPSAEVEEKEPLFAGGGGFFNPFKELICVEFSRRPHAFLTPRIAFLQGRVRACRTRNS